MRISDWSSDVCSSDLENFHSFAGVPIVRREQSVGVLCVQHVEPRRYEDVEIEALQTVAMVLAELIAGAGLVDERAASEARKEQGPLRLIGKKLVEGRARGVAVFHQPRVVVEIGRAWCRDRGGPQG